MSFLVYLTPVVTLLIIAFIASPFALLLHCIFALTKEYIGVTAVMILFAGELLGLFFVSWTFWTEVSAGIESDELDGPGAVVGVMIAGLLMMFSFFLALMNTVGLVRLFRSKAKVGAL
jgi:hypothetical protein